MLIFTASFTFPNPDGLVAAAAREKGARARVCYALALRLMTLKRSHAIPSRFSVPSFTISQTISFIFVLYFSLPYSDS